MSAEFYIVFAGDVYYPNGGMDDAQGVFTDLEKAIAKAGEFGSEYQWAQIASVSKDGITKFDLKGTTETEAGSR